MSNIQKQAINEELLQSYRSIFISSQSVFLALGALILDKSHALIVGLAAMCLLQIWWIWFRVVFSRAKIIDFYKFNIGDRFDKTGNPVKPGQKVETITEHHYVTSPKIRALVNQHLGIQTMRATRFKIDVILPLTFSLIWVVLVVFDLTN